MSKVKEKKNKQNKQPYVDLRFYITTETADYGGGYTESYAYIDRVERHKVKGVSEDDLDFIGEHVAQSDAYQLFFANDVPYTLSEGVTEKFREWLTSLSS